MKSTFSSSFEIQWYPECYDPGFMVQLFTAGYEALTPVEFLTTLANAGVERIVDVRELAISRRRGFGKSALAASLSRAGIGYAHVPNLGCPRAIRHAYRDDLNWKRYTKRYRAYLGTRDQDVEQLLDVVQRERCCLLCFEADFRLCHRSFIAERLQSLAPGIRVTHLLSPGQTRVVQNQQLAAA